MELDIHHNTVIVADKLEFLQRPNSDSPSQPTEAAPAAPAPEPTMSYAAVAASGPQQSEEEVSVESSGLSLRMHKLLLIVSR